MQMEDGADPELFLSGLENGEYTSSGQYESGS